MLQPSDPVIQALRADVDELRQLVMQVNEASVQSIQNIAKLVRAALVTMDDRISTLEKSSVESVPLKKLDSEVEL